MDIAPTLADVMGLQNDGDVDGRVFNDLVFKGDVANESLAVRKSDIKFVWNPGYEEQRQEMFDLLASELKRINDPLLEKFLSLIFMRAKR